MNLEDFVRSTLVSISRGVSKAKIECAQLVAIAPSFGEEHSESSVEFDIAISVSEEVSQSDGKGGGAEASLNVLSVKASVSGKKNSEASEIASNSEVTRVKFDVPINLSSDFASMNESGRKRYDRIVAELESEDQK
ncbi:MAG: hypothetical protein ACPG5U_08025 [Planktomarina sp.]